MKRLLSILVFSVTVKLNLFVTKEEINYYEKLINKNVFASLSYKTPTNYSGFEYDETQHPKDFGTFDFIIVGGGAAGSVLGRRLTEVKDWSVLIIEAGGRENDFTDVPNIFEYLVKSDFNWGFKTTNQANVCRASSGVCLYPRGKGLGGSTIINGGVFQRGAPADYDKWAELGNEGWSWKDVFPYMKKFENASLLVDIDEDYHGFNGPLVIESYKNSSDIKEAFIETLLSYGYNMTDYNGRNLIGVSLLQKFTNGGRRNSAAKAFLKPVENRSNLKIQLNSLVIKVEIEKSTAKSVLFIHNNTKYRVYSNKEIIVSGGAVNSPQILMLSGIGPRRDLTHLGVPVVKDLPVGKYFHDHVTVGIQALTSSIELKSLRHEIAHFLQGFGPLTTMARNEVYLFYENKNYSLTEIFYMDGFFVLPLVTHVDFLKPLKIISLFATLLHPRSIGNLTLTSKSPLDFPLINPNSLAVEEDLESLVDTLEFMNEILQKEPISKFTPVVIPIVPTCLKNVYGTRGYWRCIVKYSGFPGYHAVASCKMGNDTLDSVVNNRLVVHGMTNLRVVDLSIAPTPISGHLTAPTYMIAEKGADMIKEDNGITIKS